MVVKIRLARFGRKNAPFYNIVVAQARTARNSRPMEVVGTYDPTPRRDAYEQPRLAAASASSSLSSTSSPGLALPKPHKDIQLDTTRVRYWIGVGAQPTETVWRLLSMVRAGRDANAQLNDKADQQVGILPEKKMGAAATTASAATAPSVEAQ